MHRAVLAFLVFVAAPIAAAPAPGAEAPLARADAGATVTIDVQDAALSGVEAAPVAQATDQEEIRAYGTVLDLSQLTGLANSYARTRAQLQGANASRAASSVAFDRARTLNRDKTVSTAQMQTAQAAFLRDTATVATAAAEMRTLVATARQDWGDTIAQALVNGGPALTRLIERQDLLVQVTLPTGTALSPPPPVAAIQRQSGTPVAAAFLSGAARTDPRIQGVSLLYTVPATSGLLPGMNLLALLPHGAVANGTIVPADAIVWWEDRAWAYRQLAPGRFERVMVATGRPAAAGGYVVTTLPTGARIVVRGAQALLSQEFRAQLHVDSD